MTSYISHPVSLIHLLVLPKEASAPSQPQSQPQSTMASMETENKSTNGTATAYANGQTDTNGMSQDEQYRLPDAKTLQEVGELPIKDEDGKEVPFKTLYEDKAGRQLITFIRHFYCGVSLVTSTSPRKLS